MSKLSRPRSLLLMFGAVAVLLGSAFAEAQPKGPSSPADILFQKAVKDMQEGRYDEACEALDASLKLEQKPGTLYALADCEATRGHTADALARFTKYLELFDKMKGKDKEKHAERAAVAKEQKRKLEADVLFEKAKTALAAGKVDEACAALDQSYATDPKPGTLFARGDCEESRGRSATALEHYVAYVTMYSTLPAGIREKHAERARVAEERRKKILLEAPRLKLVWVGAVPNGLVVIRDGDESKRVALGESFPIDPGSHTFLIRLPDKPPVERKVRLEKGERKVLELRAEDAKLIEETPKPTGPVATGPRETKPEAPGHKQGMHPWKLGGIIAMGVGGATLVGGGVFGFLALKQKNIVDDTCDANFVCGTQGMKQVENFRFLGNTSTALFIVGTAAAGAGLTFFLLAPSAPKDERTALKVRSLVGPGTGFVGLEGAF